MWGDFILEFSGELIKENIWCDPYIDLFTLEEKLNAASNVFITKIIDNKKWNFIDFEILTNIKWKQKNIQFIENWHYWTWGMFLFFCDKPNLWFGNSVKTCSYKLLSKSYSTFTHLNLYQFLKYKTNSIYRFKKNVLRFFSKKPERVNDNRIDGTDERKTFQFNVY